MALVHYPRLSPDTVGTLRYYARKSRADSTRRAYASQWRAFDRWCATHGCQSLPAEPISVAAYLVYRVRAGAALATLNVSLAAVAFAHKAAGRPFDRTLGAAGWEVVAVWGTNASGVTIFILKRPLQAKA